LRARRFGSIRASLLGLATVSAITCTAEAPQPTGTAAQAVITPPLPDLVLALHSKTTITMGATSFVFGDVASSGPNGSVLFDVGSSQDVLFRVLANTIRIRTGASVGQLIGNDIINDGSATGTTLGFDPAAMPAIPAVTATTPGTTNVSTAANQTKQLCPGQYGSISLGPNSKLNLNGGVYHLTRLSLADGARLQPSEPVVLLVSGNVVTSTGAGIEPHPQALNQMTAPDIRIEVAGAVTLGESNQVRAHLLVPNGKVTTGKNTVVVGTVWAKNINIAPQSGVILEGTLADQTPSVPPPCNDNNACTADQCVSSGAIAFCRNAPEPAGTSCEDRNACNGVELCDGAGTCQPGTVAGAGTPCPDGDLCNGDETCNDFETCLPGAPPVVNDDNPCTADACDSATGVAHIPLPDGTTCNAAGGVCTAGTCPGVPPSSGSFSYSASNTDSATQNTVNFDIPIVAGQILSIGTCGLPGASGTGDTFLRLFDPSSTEVAAADDACGGVLTFFTFTAAATGTFQVRAGCFSSGSCSGTVAFTLSGL
jgi:hypothetical protein